MKTKKELEVVTALLSAPQREEYSYRMISAIKCGRYKLSIQGSGGHYCTPREILSPTDYTSMEVVIFGSRDNWVNPRRSKKLKAFPRYDELMDRADGYPSSMVYGYVDMDLINDLYLYLKGKK